MTKRVQIVPAYGRDYTSKAKVLEALNAGQDFKVADMSSQWDGMACNLENLREDGIEEVTIRYGKLMKVMTHKI